MKLKLIGTSAVLILSLIASANVHATPINYSVHGTIMDDDHNRVPVTGSMYIDDQLRSWDGAGAGQPVSPGDLGKGDKYQYAITGYSLTVGQHSLSGDRGNLNMEFARNHFGDTAWSLGKGSGKPWSGDMFWFYNRDGSRQDPSQYGKLADLIELRDHEHGSPDDTWRKSQVWLERDNPAPVPEPATLLLVGAGLVGMLRYRKARHME